MAKVIFNGKLIDEKEAKIPIADKGYFFDFAVYSSIKVIQGKVFFPDYHVDRLFESAELIGLKHLFKREDVVAWLNELVKANSIKDSLLRIVLIGDPDEKGEEKLFIFQVTGLTFYPDKLYKQGAKAITYPGERRIPQSKTKDLLLSFLAYREAMKNGAIEALLIDNEGFIREGTRSNFFAIKGKTLFAPPARKALEGVTKKIVLEAAKNDFEIRHEGIKPENLKDYDEVFLTSTLFNVMPIKIIDELVMETDFSRTKLISRLFKEFYKKNL